MTDDELDDVYFAAFDRNWRKTGRGDSSDTAGLRAVAEAAAKEADRAAVRRTLDELLHWASDGVKSGERGSFSLTGKLLAMREGLE